jgi:MFS family permease
MRGDGFGHLERWVSAGLIDTTTADRIREFESHQAPPAKTRWAATIAWGLGALLIGSGIISFVASNWEGMPQTMRMVLILILTIGFHVAAGFTSHTPALRMALHGVGTACLGAGIALAGQIFNLDSGWNGWMLLWAIGAALGYWLIRDWLQLVLAASLLPLWIQSEWNVRGPRGNDELPSLCFWLGLALLYFLSRYRPLVWLGGVALVPITILVLAFHEISGRTRQSPVEAYWAFLVVIAFLALVGWRTFGGFDIRGFSAIAAVVLISYASSEVGGWQLYLIFGIAFVALCAWGVEGQRSELVNMGVAGFAITLFGFYVSHALTLLGSSIGLIVLGLLMLGGGFALEKTRRRLLGQMT